MRRFLSALLSILIAAPVAAGTLVNVEVIDRTRGQSLTHYWHAGKTWVAGQPGNRYSIRVTNNTGGRVLAVLSVDGVNAVSGETAAAAQAGYVLGPYESAEIAGWRKSLDDVAQFYFTALGDSYAARTGRPDNVGVIGVAAFREKPYVRPWFESRAAAPAPGREAAGAPAETGVMGKSQADAKLGTGHGEREYAPVSTTSFERATGTPAEVVTLRYDSYPNLVARGIIPPPWPRQGPEPQPFPGSFVPDPRG